MVLVGALHNKPSVKTVLDHCKLDGSPMTYLLWVEKPTVVSFTEVPRGAGYVIVECTCVSLTINGV